MFLMKMIMIMTKIKHNNKQVIQSKTEEAKTKKKKKKQQKTRNCERNKTDFVGNVHVVCVGVVNVCHKKKKYKKKARHNKTKTNADITQKCCVVE